MDLTEDRLRSLACQALWRALERDPALTTEPVSFPDGVTSCLDLAEWLPGCPEAEALRMTCLFLAVAGA
jgi:hypothetical protein